jgi:hypothetical protein
MQKFIKKIFAENRRFTNEYCYLMPLNNGKYSPCPIDAPTVKNGGCANCRIERWLNSVSYAQQVQNNYSYFFYDMDTFNNYADFKKGGF